MAEDQLMCNTIEATDQQKLLDRISELEAENERLRSENARPNAGASDGQSGERTSSLVAELEKVSRELNDFAYIVSHDLKAPLRGIKTLASWIASDYGEKLGEEGNEQLKLLQSRVDRMEGLIDGILQYSRIGRVTEEPIPVDIKQLLTDIMDAILPPDGIKAAIETDMPTVVCEKTRLAQLFEHLIDNAVKFMDKPDGRIRIGCRRDDGSYVFSVGDNGPGIDSKHHEKVFGLFHTLKPKDQCESTGIGLTLAKKIVESNGGKIWIESEAGKGATFHFSWPDVQISSNTYAEDEKTTDVEETH